MKTFNDSLILAVSSAYGIYTPQTFVERYGMYLNLSQEDKDIISDVDSEVYWEVWEKITNKNFVIGGVEYSILENEDTWIIPSHLEVPEDFWI